MQRLRAEFASSERDVCELLLIPRSTCRYRSCRDDSVLREQLITLAREKPRFGYRRLHISLRRNGQRCNHKRVQQRVIEQRGRPEVLRSDNGSEITSRHYLALCEERGIGTLHIQPGRPMQNGHVGVFTVAIVMNA